MTSTIAGLDDQDLYLILCRVPDIQLRGSVDGLQEPISPTRIALEMLSRDITGKMAEVKAKIEEVKGVLVRAVTAGLVTKMGGEEKFLLTKKGVMWISAYETAWRHMFADHPQESQQGSTAQPRASTQINIIARQYRP
jgi:hypothetical protein